MSSNNPTSILASFSTMKSLVDAQQYQSPYQILAEFIQYIIIKSNLHSFTAIEMKNRLFEVFGFDIPEAVARTTVRGLQFVKTENRIYHVNPIELKDNSAFEEMKAVTLTSILLYLVTLSHEKSHICLPDKCGIFRTKCALRHDKRTFGA